MDCKKCSCDVPAHRRDCPSCGTDNGFPNVRASAAEEEVVELEARLNRALEAAKARGCQVNLEEFGDAVGHSKAVIARPIGIINGLISDEKTSYVSFQRQVDARIRNPQDNIFDRVRMQYEEALYPYFSKEIVFASLSLSNAGMSGYGSHAMILKNGMIDERASVFEENPHLFVEKHKIILNKPIPKGFRADWPNRGKLAMAKLHSKIESSTTAASHPGILETDNGGSGDSDWIEVHIYGEITRNAIEAVSGATPKVRADRVIWKSLKNKLSELGVEVIEL